jgi:hypothetical protein
MKKILRSLLTFTVGIVALGLVPLTVQAETKTAQSGKIKAEVSYDRQEFGLKNLRLKVSRSGQVVYDKPILDSDYYRLAEFENQVPKIVDLDGDSEPEVVVDLFSGGAHCCTASWIYRYQPRQRTYDFIQVNWRDIGYKLQDLDQDGIPEFKSADASFAYAFSSFAGSGFPIAIWQYRQGRLINVTRRYPKLVYADALRYWQIYERVRSEDSEVKGILAAYLANKYLLGQAEDGWKQVRAAYQDKDREQYFTELRKFLRDRKYDR